MKNTKKLIGAGLALLLCLQSAPAKADVDLLVELDSSVVAMHDFSVLSAQINSNSKPDSVKTINSSLNQQLGTIRTKLTKFDKDLTHNWVYLTVDANYLYPGRETLRKFDLTAFKWYTFELSAQKQITACYKNVATSTKCVSNIRAKNKASELKLYGAVTSVLNQIQVWRKIAKR
jgi:hypothetical protein